MTTRPMTTPGARGPTPPKAPGGAINDTPPEGGGGGAGRARGGGTSVVPTSHDGAMGHDRIRIS